MRLASIVYIYSIKELFAAKFAFIPYGIIIV